jgi:nucleoside 2-deoxyribosyltransferase
MSRMKSNLFNKVIQIAGSCSPNADPDLIEFSHKLIKFLTTGLLERKVIVVTTVGDDVRLKSNDTASPSLIYYWDVLEAVHEYAESMSFSDEIKSIVKVVSSEKAEAQIPKNKKEMWHELISKGIVSLYNINPGWNSGALKRQEQERLSDALIIFGGGAGVEHLAHLYVSHGKPVLPLDMPLGPSCDDGVGGASFYSRFAISDPKKFMPIIKEDTTSKLLDLRYENWLNSPEKYAYRILDFLETTVKPQVFYVRLLKEDEEEYPLVEDFFRNIVDPIVQNLKYHIKEMGRSETKEAFLNIEIFKEINNSSIIIVDLSGLRPNCFMEMGYAFGLDKRVILTAKLGTKLPFDSNAIPCHFWNPNISVEKQQESFMEFWERNINRPALVSTINVI